jgi:hypothetical protein
MALAQISRRIAMSHHQSERSDCEKLCNGAAVNSLPGDVPP